MSLLILRGFPSLAWEFNLRCCASLLHSPATTREFGRLQVNTPLHMGANQLRQLEQCLLSSSNPLQVDCRWPRNDGLTYWWIVSAGSIVSVSRRHNSIIASTLAYPVSLSPV
jgi:hypothetical protein